MTGPVTTFLLRLLEPLLERTFPRLYQPKFAVSEWKVGYAVEGVPRDVDFKNMKEYERADLVVREGLSGQFSFSFEANLYSHLGTGIRDIKVVFVTEDGQEDVHRILEPQNHKPLSVLNVPARQWEVREVTGSFPIEDEAVAIRLAQCKHVKLRAYMPSGRIFESTIVENPLHR
jgi:hypothetical protein